VDDFLTGLFAALSSTGWIGLSIRDESFDKGLVPAFDKLVQLAPDKKLNINFRIRLSRFHGDSITVRDAIYSAAQRGLISLDNPEYQYIRFLFGHEQAEDILQGIPGGKALFQDIAKEFINSYEVVPVAN